MTGSLQNLHMPQRDFLISAQKRGVGRLQNALSNTVTEVQPIYSRADGIWLK